MVEKASSADEPGDAGAAPRKPARTPRARTSAATAGSTRRAAVSKAPAEPDKPTRSTGGRASGARKSSSRTTSVDAPAAAPIQRSDVAGPPAPEGTGSAGRVDPDATTVTLTPIEVEVPTSVPELAATEPAALNPAQAAPPTPNHGDAATGGGA
ncbi:hypothetical protein ACFF2X_42835, partial [Cryptosporangium minutisporangium]